MQKSYSDYLNSLIANARGNCAKSGKDPKNFEILYGNAQNELDFLSKSKLIEFVENFDRFEKDGTNRGKYLDLFGQSLLKAERHEKDLEAKDGEDFEIFFDEPLPAVMEVDANLETDILWSAI